MKPRPRPATHRQLARYLLSLPLERRLLLYLEEMAESAAVGDLPAWLMARHLFDMTVLGARREIAA